MRFATLDAIDAIDETARPFALSGFSKSMRAGAMPLLRMVPAVNTPDASLYYEVHGEGHPVIFVHGGGGNTMCWFQQVPYFRDRYKVVTVDLRGFKQSHCAPRLVHPRYFPDDMRAIMDALGVERAAFVCQSLGAWAGLPLAVRSPERVPH